MVDLSATHTADVMTGQGWEAGVVDGEGYCYAWSTVYQDVMELDRPTLDDLVVSDTIAHTKPAFPIEDGFELG